MAHADAFTPDEWSQVTLAPMLASYAVTAADPGGLIGLFQEGAAAGKALLAGKKDQGSLASEVVATYESSDGRKSARENLRAMVSGKKPVEAMTEAVSKLEQIASIVDAKAPGDAAGFKHWLLSVAQDVASAGTEGGFLGFGGEKVSDAERKALSDIEAALGLATG